MKGREIERDKKNQQPRFFCTRKNAREKNTG